MGGRCFLNHGSSNSRGTLIAFSERFDKKTVKYIDDKIGRTQLLTFEHKNKKYMLINLYNNNIEREQVETLKKMDELIEGCMDVNEYNILIGGDWNFILEKEVDAYGGNPRLKLNSITEHCKLKNKFLLCDIFRVRNPGLKRFTFRQQTPCLARRLDRFLISNALQTKVISCEILSSLQSDHSPVCLKINTKDGHFKKGGNYWKFNSSLLKDNIFVTGLKEMVESKRVEYMGMDNQIKWELIKFEIRKFAMNYSKKVARENRRVLRRNENIMKDFETKPRNEHTFSDDDYRRAKQEVELFHLEKAKGQIQFAKNIRTG